MREYENEGLMRPFRGLASEGRSEVVIKRSRFLGYAWPETDEGRVRERLARLRTEHPDARHVCFAYRLGLVKESVRMSDDGEPAGTAGKPILEVLLQQDVRNAAIAVVRYFGGILLGAPGLVRAYSQAAAEAVHRAGIREMVPHAEGVVSLPYGRLDLFRHRLAAAGGREEKAEYGATVRLRVVVPVEAREAVEKQLASLGKEASVTWEGRVVYRPAPR